MGHLSRLWEAFVIFGPVFAILFGISGGFLFLGITKYDECPFEPFLSQGLIGFGIITLICTIIILIFMVILALKVDDSGTHLTYLLCAFVVMGVYGIVTTILAYCIGYTLYQKPVQYQSENLNDLKTFCHASIYNFSHGFVVTVIGLSSILIICLIRLCIKRMFKFFVKKSIDSVSSH